MKRSPWLVKTSLSLSILTGIAACGSAPESTSQVTVTNGREVAEGDYPSVVLLYDKAEGAICTGTFISPTVVLSAAHCTMGGKVDADDKVDHSLAIIRITDPVNKKAELVAESTQVVRNRLWDANGGNVNKYDLSLITFPEGTAKAVSEIAPARAKVGDLFTIVGYGLNQMADTKDGSSAGIKREGNNKVTSISGGFIQFSGKDKTTTGDGTDSSSASGDSGGPLFINGALAGVTSGGGWGGFGRTRSLYVDLYSAESQAFLNKHLSR